MAEVAELLHPSDTEDEELDDEAATWPLPCASPPAFGPGLHRCCDRSLHLVSGGAGRELPIPDPNTFVPVFTPLVHHSSFGRLDRQIPSDSDSESSYLDDQATLALDLFERSSPQHESSGGGGGDGGQQVGPFSNSEDPYSFGVFDGVEDVGSDYLELGLGLGFGLAKSKEDEEGSAGVDLEGDEGSDWGGDTFFVGERSVVSASRGADGEPSRSREGEGLRIVGFESHSDSEEVEEISSRMRSRPDGGDVPDMMFDNLGLPLCWDCVRIEEDRREPNEDFEWEQVEVRASEGEVASRVIDDDDDDSSIAPEDENSDLELEDGEEGAAHNVVWEVLLAMNDPEGNVPIGEVGHEDAESYLGEEHDYVYTSEYELLFDQFGDHENFVKGGRPAAEVVIESLPSVVLTQLDVANNNTLCAVCKDEITLEEKAKQLPCSHHYHGDCILPWLRIRNTCPVCRYELPTDDPNYENWLVWRDGSGGTVQGFQVRYDFGIFPEE